MHGLAFSWQLKTYSMKVFPGRIRQNCIRANVRRFLSTFTRTISGLGLVSTRRRDAQIGQLITRKDYSFAPRGWDKIDSDFMFRAIVFCSLITAASLATSPHFNEFTGKPPQIFTRNSKWAYLTMNTSLSPSVDPRWLICVIRFAE
jgi:hypothetical protein